MGNTAMTRRAIDILGTLLDSAAEDRVRLMDEACGDDGSLRNELMELVRALDNPDDFLARPPLQDPEFLQLFK